MTIPNSDPHTLDLLRLQEDSPVLIGLYDPGEVLRYANKSFRQAYGIAPGEVISWSDILRRNYANNQGARIETNDFEGWLASVKSRRGKQAYRSFEVDLCDGRWCLMTQTQDAQGWMLVVSTDITALRTGERGLRVQRDAALIAAQTDVLTGISNRAHIFRLLQDQIHYLQQGGKSCGLAVIDLDHFKDINDTYGHQCGDTVLKNFAGIVAHTLRRADGFGRVGGEEFLLLLPDVDRMQVESIVNRILQMVRAAQPLAEFPSFRHTCSAGLLMLRADLDSETAFRVADEALYAAKRSGRDQVVWADGNGSDSR